MEMNNEQQCVAVTLRLDRVPRRALSTKSPLSIKLPALGGGSFALQPSPASSLSRSIPNRIAYHVSYYSRCTQCSHSDRVLFSLVKTRLVQAPTAKDIYFFRS